ncbi:YbjQ family protein [Thalassolituus sp.]|jgi:uncharacterized protein YbjQ (UPF0145 family)|uniref:YbjQ family protein n=1 Tax=Thalassolituus sp. TaxID=2030822 RepID=UPI002617501E|nr:YbjQ family protein [uncultured Thalassolituus sp.]
MGFLYFLALLIIGYLFGKWAEKRHYRSIHEREDSLRDLLVLPVRVPEPQHLSHDSTLVTGSVVISVDYFKTVAASLRNLFGGRVGAYETLIDRARREATLRMQEDAQLKGAELIYNVKYETSRIGDNAGKGLGSVEVLAYGTALIPTR